MKNVDIDKKEVLADIKQLSCFASLSCDIDFLDQGLSSNNVKVTTFDPQQQVTAQYFVKWFSGAEQAARGEVAIARLAMQYGLAPMVIYSSEEYLVTDFVQGETLQSILLKQPSQLSSAVEQTVSLVAQLHQLPASNMVEPFDILALLSSLKADCHFNSAHLNDVNHVIAQLPAIERSITPVICHGDANFSNVLVDDTDRHWLIDFECSIFTDAEFDIAMCIAINQLNDNAVSTMLQTYQQCSGKRLSSQLVNTYIPYCALINALWFIAKAKKSPQKATFLKHAEQQLTQIEAYTTPCLLKRLFTHST
ncbi:phosphotransferase [Thalassotalea hakodatensis]|uniref:phosphotransferase n=1 Tax=Thalassotalea hakodatensis TaxID=3030492 RepID=UPI002572BC22|nr:phosphotransferase [Thalassotalea hakodatensis]